MFYFVLVSSKVSAYAAENEASLHLAWNESVSGDPNPDFLLFFRLCYA